MYKEDVIEYFGTATKVEKALGFSSTGSVSQWKKVIPKLRAMELATITNGKLKYDPSLYGKAA